MSDTMEKQFTVSSSAHFRLGISTQKIMLCVILALLPECINGVRVFGLRALAVILVSVLGAVCFEALFQFITKQKITINNLSAVVSGIMLALVLPSTVPFWILLLGDLVALVVAKALFGGLGSNVFNPALTGRAVLFISFPAIIGAQWFNPELVSQGVSKFDAISSATVLASVKSGNFIADANFFTTYFFGNRAGCIGETSIFLILISFAFLLVTKIIDWRAPLTMVLTVALGTFFLSLGRGNGLNSSCTEVLVALVTGGLLFGATFMVTDYATTPVTKPGRLVFGFGCGLITFLIRSFGNYPEGVMFSILIMNAVAPLLNNLTCRMYGYGKKALKKTVPKFIVQEFDLKNAKVTKQEDVK